MCLTVLFHNSLQVLFGLPLSPERSTVYIAPQATTQVSINQSINPEWKLRESTSLTPLRQHSVPVCASLRIVLLLFSGRWWWWAAAGRWWLVSLTVWSTGSTWSTGLTSIGRRRRRRCSVWWRWTARWRFRALGVVILGFYTDTNCWNCL